MHEGPKDFYMSLEPNRIYKPIQEFIQVLKNTRITWIPSKLDNPKTTKQFCNDGRNAH